MQREHSVSSLRKWRGCKRRYRYEYIDGYVPPAGKALSIGIAMHEAWEVFDAGGSLDEALARLNQQPWEMKDGEIELRRARAMMRAYFDRWADLRSEVEVVESEHPFKAPVGSSIIKGRNDALWRCQGKLYLVERKTTSEEIATVGADYWQRLALDIQVTVYPWEAARRHGTTPSILYDVVRKPTGKPRMKERVAKRKSETPEQFEGRKAEAYETLDEFEARLVREMLADPDQYLVRREVHRTADQNETILAELREDLVILDNYQGCYPRNDAACSSKFGQCPFLGVCTGTETLDSGRFDRREKKTEQQPQPNTEVPHGSDSYADCPI